MEENIKFCKPYSGIDLDVRLGDSISYGREGRITIFAHNIRMQNLFAFFCAHVLPDDVHEGQTFLLATNCECQNPSRQCECSNGPKINLGILKFKKSPWEENPINSDFIDIACCCLDQKVSKKCDLRVFGPKNGTKIVNDKLPLENSRVFKRNQQNEISYGQHIGFAELVPAEVGDPPQLDSQPQRSFQIPFGGVPRRVELVKSEDGRKLGLPGDSGLLFSIVSTKQNATYVRPSLVYIGAWPEDPENISMCSRLQDSMERLAEKYGCVANFALCHDNSFHERENMHSNTRKRTADNRGSENQE